MEGNEISISSEKEKPNNLSNIQVINQNKSNNNQPSMTNNTTENINSNDNNNNSLNVLNFINEMPFENLNDYYDIESSLFLKRIEKLNLKFFWTSECVLNQQDIKYPYNKLFLILFKQISLYIEEISRLNKQLKQKNKNEKYYQIKLAQMKQKEKEYILNRQMVKNLQRDTKLLEKKNDKYRNEIDKLNKKLSNTYQSINFNSSNNTTTNAMLLQKNNNFFFVSPKNSSTSVGYDSLITHNSPFNKKNNKISDFSYINDKNKYTINVRTKYKHKTVSNSIDNSLLNKNKTTNDNDYDETISKAIIQCDEEIDNLDLIEGILKEIKSRNNNNKNNNIDKLSNASNIGNNSKNKKGKIYNKSGIPVKKKFHRSYKSDDLQKK